MTEPWRFDEASVNLVCMPLFHIGGCGWGLVGMTAGCVSIIAREFNPQAILDLMQKEAVTNTIFVPAMLGFMAQVPGAAERTFPALRSIVYGASPITNETLLSAMKVFKCDFVQVFGMTETTGAITELPAADHDPNGNRAHLLRSAGKPYPWVEAKIVDLETGKDAATGAVGELWTRSAQNMAGYWNKPEETAKTLLPDGWLRTGDAGYIDAEGYLFLTDRVKDMIVSGGENIYPGRGRECAGLASGHRRGRGHRRARREVGRDGQGHRRAEGGRARRRGVDHRLRQGAPRQLQVPDIGRFHGTAAAQPLRQGPEEGFARALLGWQGAGHQLRERRCQTHGSDTQRHSRI